MKRIIALLIIMVLSCPLMYAPSIGSTTAVSVQAFASFLSTDTNNTMLGFAEFQSGFALQDNKTTCTYNDVFPVSGTMTLSNGALWLLHDLVLQNLLVVDASGTIQGSGYSVFTPAANTAFNLPILPNLKFIAEANLSSSINSIDWSFDGKYLALIPSAGTLYIYNFNGSSLVSATTESASGDSVRWSPINYFVIWGTTGSSPGFNNIFLSEFSSTSSTFIAQGATSVNGGATVTAVAWRPNGTSVAYGTSGDQVGVVAVSGTGAVSLPVTPVTAPGAVQTNAISWNPAGSYFAVGVAANATADLLIYNFNSTTSAASQSAAVDINTAASVTAVDWSKTNSLIAVGMSGGTNNVAIYSYSITTSTLTQLAPSLIGETRNVSSIQWQPGGNFLAVATAVVGTTAPAEVTVYSFNSTTSTLTATERFGVFNTINSLAWMPSGTLLATGDASDYLSVYQNNVSNNFTFANTSLVLQSPLTMQVNYIFTGTCVIEGNGNTIDCTTGIIQISNNSNLTIRNATIQGVSFGKVVCLNGAAQFTLQNVDWIQTGSFSFSQGSLNIAGDVRMTGPYVFAYTSTQASTINQYATWSFDSGMTFSYAPASGGANNLITMIDATSLLHLYETTLYAPSTGLKFTKGTIVVEGICPVTSDAVTSANGILFGDNSSSANDAVLNVWPESSFQINRGFLVYQNV